MAVQPKRVRAAAGSPGLPSISCSNRWWHSGLLLPISISTPCWLCINLGKSRSLKWGQWTFCLFQSIICKPVVGLSESVHSNFMLKSVVVLSTKATTSFDFQVAELPPVPDTIVVILGPLSCRMSAALLEITVSDEESSRRALSSNLMPSFLLWTMTGTHRYDCRCQLCSAIVFSGGSSSETS